MFEKVEKGEKKNQCHMLLSVEDMYFLLFLSPGFMCKNYKNIILHAKVSEAPILTSPIVFEVRDLCKKYKSKV